MHMHSKLFTPLKVREFRLFWLATSISLIGDQLTFIALPWLVLKLTGDALMMGTVLALAAIPRALFMLVGGAVTDRYSPRVIMLLSNALRMVLMGILTWLTYTNTIEMWMLFALALSFGLADAFMFPAASAYPPRLLPREQLAAGNSLVQGTAQLSIALGPLVAGFLIYLAGSNNRGVSQDTSGLAMVFAIDALTFLVPVFVFQFIKDQIPVSVDTQSKTLDLLKQGLSFTWQDIPLRLFACILGFMGFLLRGPIMVGMPVYADSSLKEGAMGFSVMASAYGLGSILGALIAGVRKAPRANLIGRFLFLDYMAFGLVLILMVLTNNLWLISIALLLAAIIDGYIMVVTVTWIQKRVSAEMLGRVMSIVGFMSQGLYPISAALAGIVASWSLSAMLSGAGAALVFISVVALLIPGVRRMGYATDSADD